jgi:CDP-glucose 4,6-dehydratase
MVSDCTWSGKKVLVTGGTGFIGSHLVRKLCKLGANVSVLVHKTPYIGNEFVTQIFGDLRENNTGWQTLVEILNPDVVFHLAAQPIVGIAGENELETLQTNVGGTYNLLSVCKKLLNLSHFVHISTDKVYGDIDAINKDTIPQGVKHPYNVSKLASDGIAQMYSNFFDVPMTIIRNANVYGAGDTHFDRIVPRTIQRAFLEQSPVIRGDGNNKRDYIHVSDIVDGYVAAAELPTGKEPTILNLGGHNHSVLEVVDTVLKEMNRVDLAPLFEKQWKGEIPNQHIVNDKAKELIGWNPKVDLENGIRITVPWYINFLGRKNGKG